MSEEIDDLIEGKEAELSPLRLRMEELKEEFTGETVDFASKWFGKTAKNYVAKYTDVTLNMSQERIAAMKIKVNSLVKNSEKIVKAELDNTALWWHMEPHLHDSIERYRQVADKYPEVLDSAVRRALGQLGIVLEQFGFRVTVSGNSGTYFEFWFETPAGTHQIVPWYPHIVKWTEQMQETIRQYNELYGTAKNLFNEIQLLKEEKKKQEALTLWDSL